jgi:hypothetical protein
MTFPIIRAATKAELSDDLHIIRILLILGSASKRKTTTTVQGITKLAKLDFLLRYPNCLKRALLAERKDLDSIKIVFNEFELHSIESKMIRFKYGPWDQRYRRWIGILVSKGLAITFVKGRTVCVEITELGKTVFEQIKYFEDFATLTNRCDIILKVFGTFSATKLMRFIYQTFPELTTMKWGEEIEL